MSGKEESNLRWVRLEIFRRNPRREFEDLLKSANDGDPNAYSHLGYAYETGEGLDSPDYEKAFEWYEKAYEQIHDVWGLIGLGRLYYYGHGVTKNLEKAFRCFKEAENIKVDYVYLMLGKMHHLGEGAEKDSSKARGYYKLAIDSGNVVGMRNLGILEQELGNYWRGLFLRVKAAARGFRIALSDIDDRRIAG